MAPSDALTREERTTDEQEALTEKHYQMLKSRLRRFREEAIAHGISEVRHAGEQGPLLVDGAASEGICPHSAATEAGRRPGLRDRVLGLA